MAIVDGYATLDEIKADLRLTTTVDDERLERSIEAASRQIDNTTHRKWNAPVTEVRASSSSGTTVWVDEVENVTLVEQSSDQVTWSEVAAGSYVTNPRGLIRKLVLLPSGAEWLAFVRLDADWDGAPIPPEANQACRIQAVRLFKRPDTPEGVLQGDFGAMRLARVDPDLLALIRPLARKVIG